MEKIGSIVSVSTKGICEVVDVKENAFVGAVKGKLYYVLKPIENTNNMLVYLPVDGGVQIRKLVGKAEAKKIIEGFADIDEIPISSELERLKIYNDIAKSGNISEWAKLLKTLKTRKEKLSKKQISSVEQKMLNTISTCVVDELSVVLDKPKTEIEERLAL